MNSFFRAVLVPSDFNFLVTLPFRNSITVTEISVSLVNNLENTKCTNGLGGEIFPARMFCVSVLIQHALQNCSKCPSFS